MKYLLLIFFLSVLQNAVHAQCSGRDATEVLDANVLKAALNPLTLWNAHTSSGLSHSVVEDYVLIGAGGIWSTSQSDGNIATAISVYGFNSGEYDYQLGPIIVGTQLSDTSNQFCNIASVTRIDVTSHLLDLADQNLDHPLPSIMKWPARGNENIYMLASDQDLAPFVDVNNNQVYEPHLGDYPDFRGDQALWWVVNDFVSHEEGHSPISGIEVQVLAQAFHSDEFDSPAKSQLYTIKTINRLPYTKDSVSTSLWMDINLGCSLDDLIGTIPDLKAVYGYNASRANTSSTSPCEQLPSGLAEIPVVAARVLSGRVGTTPLQTRNSALSFEINSVASNSTSFPRSAYHLAHGRWHDGKNITIGGDGYQSHGAPTNWIYSGNPADSTSWSQCGSDGSDVRALLNANLLQPLAPNEAFEVDFAVMVLDDIPLPCPDSDLIAAEVEAASNHLITGNTSSSREVQAAPAALSLWPNPSSGRFQVTLPDGVRVKQIRVLDVGGRTVAHQLHNQTPTTLDLELESNGVYLISLEDEAGYFRYGRVVVR